jgi:hypothetical protein
MNKQSIMQESRDELFVKYKYDIKYPTGWNKPLEDCKTASDQYISEILEYLVNPYPLNKLKSPNWDQDLLSVALGLKPCALIDNDSHLDPTIDTFLRHNLELLGIVKKFVISDEDDTGMIYYNKAGFGKAVLLFQYHKGLLEPEITKQISDGLDYYQAICLGYSKESLALYIHSSKIDSMLDRYFGNLTVAENPDEKFTDEEIEFNIWTPERKTKILETAKPEEKRKLYGFIYQVLQPQLDEIYEEYDVWESMIDVMSKPEKLGKYAVLREL